MRTLKIFIEEQSFVAPNARFGFKIYKDGELVEFNYNGQTTRTVDKVIVNDDINSIVVNNTMTFKTEDAPIDYAFDEDSLINSSKVLTNGNINGYFIMKNQAGDDLFEGMIVYGDFTIYNGVPTERMVLVNTIDPTIIYQTFLDGQGVDGEITKIGNNSFLNNAQPYTESVFIAGEYTRAWFSTCSNLSKWRFTTHPQTGLPYLSFDSEFRNKMMAGYNGGFDGRINNIHIYKGMIYVVGNFTTYRNQDSKGFAMVNITTAQLRTTNSRFLINSAYNTGEILSVCATTHNSQLHIALGGNFTAYGSAFVINLVTNSIVLRGDVGGYETYNNRTIVNIFPYNSMDHYYGLVTNLPQLYFYLCGNLQITQIDNFEPMEINTYIGVLYKVGGVDTIDPSLYGIGDDYLETTDNLNGVVTNISYDPYVYSTSEPLDIRNKVKYISGKFSATYGGSSTPLPIPYVSGIAYNPAYGGLNGSIYLTLFEGFRIFDNLMWFGQYDDGSIYNKPWLFYGDYSQVTVNNSDLVSSITKINITEAEHSISQYIYDNLTTFNVLPNVTYTISGNVVTMTYEFDDEDIVITDIYDTPNQIHLSYLNESMTVADRLNEVMVRSSYLVYGTDPDMMLTTFDIKVWEGNILDADSQPVLYSKTKQKIMSDQGRVYINISNLVKENLEGRINSFLNSTSSATQVSPSGMIKWAEVIGNEYDDSNNLVNQTKRYYAVLDGYLTPEQDDTIFPNILMTGNRRQVVRGTTQRIYFIVNNLSSIKIYNDGVYVQDVIFEIDVTDNRKYIQSYRVPSGDGYNNVRIELTYIDGDSTSIENMYFDIIDECKFDKVTLAFKNKYGVMESFPFNKRKIESLKTTKEEYNRSIVDFNGNYDVNRHSNNTYNVDGQGKYVLNSGFIPEYMNDSIDELMMSEEVWMVINDQEIIPVIIETDSIQFKTIYSDRSIQYSMNVKTSHNQVKYFI